MSQPDAFAPAAPTRFDPATTRGPSEQLLRLYALCSLPALIFAPVVFGVLYIRYRTMRFHFDEEGVRVSYGLLFKRETSLAYRRIQDIHVYSHIVERWLGLARVAVQTASGSASAEITFEGIPDPEGLRDFLYARMRGAKGLDGAAYPRSADAGSEPRGEAEVIALLNEIRSDLSAVRAALAGRGGGVP
ncbi:MAG: PH domain-containing protein [Phycisphaerales bacterium]|nr:PH domain-containing protein [Phycisphaerales bacterium]